ncbi:hypothetical protein [Deinococcus sp. PEB2-63]
MTFKSPPAVSRRLERAALRRGPAWHPLDVLLLAALLITAALALFAPGILADLGDTQIGPDAWIADLNGSLSGALLAAGRWAVVTLVGYTFWHVREAPLAQRGAWLMVATGLLMNYSRNVYTGAPCTLSFLVIQAGLLLLLFRLSIRPTVWQQMQSYRDRAERAEAELARLKGEA